MLRGNWLQRLGELCGRKHGTHANTKVLSKRRRQAVVSQPADVLEARSMLSVSVLYVPLSGELNLELGSSDNVRVGSVNGLVRIDSISPAGVATPVNSVGSLPAQDVRLIVIVGGDDGNSIDLSGVTAAAFTSFPSLTQIEVDAGNGDDLITGSPDFADSLVGGNGKDTILGQGGNDTLVGGDGDDSLDGGAGNDGIRAGNGQDFVLGNAGNDSITAGDGFDTVAGGDGEDSLDGGDGNDSVRGGAGNDLINGMMGNDTLIGEDGNDLILGGSEHDSLFGDSDDPAVLGSGQDTLFGNAGNDTLVGGGGLDNADGGAGNDLVLSTFQVTTTNDPVPSAATPPTSAGTPVALPDATASGLATTDVGAVHNMSTGSGDASLQISVNATGTFGTSSAIGGTNPGAFYDPLGTGLGLAAATTAFESGVYLRQGTGSGTRQPLDQAATSTGTILGTTTEANSSFAVGLLDFELVQTVEPVFDIVTRSRVGSLLTQTYQITNRSAATSDFELVRYMDGDLNFTPPASTDGGGRLVSTAGDEFLFETDAGGTVASATFVGITSKGGTIPAANRFEINQFSDLQTNITNGTALNDQVLNDTNGDQSTDSDYNVTLGLRNTFSLAPNGTATYTTHTLFGTPNQIQLNQQGPTVVDDSATVAFGQSATIDVVANDSDVDGTLDYSSIQIDQPPANGTATPLGDGRILYTPNAGFSGTDTFNYTIADDLGARSAPATVTVKVAVPDAIGDLLNAGQGDDTAIGADGNDTLLGGAGKDSLLGGTGNDTIQGQGGNDTLNGGGGADNLNGGDGNDLVQSLTAGIVINDVTISEGDLGTANADFTVGLTFASDQTVTVSFTALGGTATSVADFTATSGTLTFLPGVTTQTVSVPVIGDTIPELTETFFVTLFNAVNADIVDNQGQATITDTDVIVGATLTVGTNINVSNLPGFQSEVTIAVNPTNPMNLVAGSNDPSSGVMDAYFSIDGGVTWQFRPLPLTVGGTTFQSATDPVVAYDRQGVAYFAYELLDGNNAGANVIARSTDGGDTWSAVLVTPAGSGDDKEWFAVGPDPSNLAVDRYYYVWQRGNRIFISTSSDSLTWSTPLQISDGASAGKIDCIVSVGPNGEVYVVWEDFQTVGVDRIVVDRSFDGGQTFTTDTLVTTTNLNPFFDPGSGGTDYVIPAQPTRGIWSAVSIDVDRSTGSNRGRVYISFGDQGDGDGDPITGHDDTDVFLVYSDNQGANWTPRVRVNDDATTTSQFFPWMAVDPVTGFVSTAWYDARNDVANNQRVETFITTSIDGGDTFAPSVRVATAPSDQSVANANADPNQYGDYSGLAVYNNVAHPIWTDSRDQANPDVFTATVTIAAITSGGGGGVSIGTLLAITDAGDTLNGGAGNDTVFGASGNDFINGNAGDDLLSGGGGNDLILGGAEADTLLGGNDNDTLDGQGGADVLNGGLDNDTYLWNGAPNGNDTIVSASGLDTASVNGTSSPDAIAFGQSAGNLTASFGGATLTIPRQSAVANLVVNGLAGNDTLSVGTIDQVRSLVLILNGGDGDDLLDALGANIGGVRLALNGDIGNDTINGSLGNDTLSGGDGDDSCVGFAGNDTIIGGAGQDLLGGGLGNDSINGGEGHDALNGQQGDDSVLGGLGNDTLKGDIGNDTLLGGSGDDNLNGMAGDDSILGGVGQDALLGGVGNDTLDGGRNDDMIGGNAGDDRILGDHGNDVINAGDGNNTISGGDGDDTITAGVGNDLISGGDGNDRINADSGDDTIVGGDGNDSVQAGAGQDVIRGGDGDDSINGQGGTDTIASGQGNDIVVDPVSEIHEDFVLSATILAILDAI